MNLVYPNAGRPSRDKAVPDRICAAPVEKTGVAQNKKGCGKTRILFKLSQPAPGSRSAKPVTYAAPGPAYAAFSKTSSPFAAVMTTASLGPKRPWSMAFDNGFSISCWIARFRGRAP